VQQRWDGRVIRCPVPRPGLPVPAGGIVGVNTPTPMGPEPFEMFPVPGFTENKISQPALELSVVMSKSRLPVEVGPKRWSPEKVSFAAGFTVQQQYINQHDEYLLVT